MNARLLTLTDLYNFYSTKKKSMKFSADKNGEPIAVQVAGTLLFKKELENINSGLTQVRLQACHTETNLNKSTISLETMRDKLLPTFQNRPILAYIHEVNGVPQFYEHNAHEENGEIVYDEIAVGNIPESNNAELVYDEENDRYNVMIDGYLYDEYTKASEIVKREEECPVSVEISITKMSWNNTDKTLHIEDGYFSGIAILGYDDNGNKVMPGMANSNIRLKDFSQSNNSILSDLSESEYSKLVETLDKLNETLSKFDKKPNITENFEKGGNGEINMSKFEELLTKYNKTAEDITFEYEGLSDEELESKFAEVFDETEPKNDPEDPVDPEEPKDPENDPDDLNGNTTTDPEEPVVKEPESAEDPVAEPVNEPVENSFSKTFTLSHEDLRASLYALLAPVEESLNEYYWIVQTFDNHFVYQSCCGNFYSQKFTTENDSVAFDGERVEVFAEFVTADEKAELDNMRANYSSISEKLAKYENAEVMADKMTVFSDEAYTNYLETKEFKSLMSEENMKKFSKEELVEKADAALGRLVKVNKTFSYQEPEKKEKPKPATLAFGAHEGSSSFLDSLLKKKN